jgi:hypothetical protein
LDDEESFAYAMAGGGGGEIEEAMGSRRKIVFFLPLWTINSWCVLVVWWWLEFRVYALGDY